MNAQERRIRILTSLREVSSPVSASVLAGQLGVSRQIIVGDVALLRAAGEEILSTPRGYVLTGENVPLHPELRRQIVCSHTADQMQEELQVCVDNGCTVLDVIVDHPVYGQLAGQLQLKTRYDISQFMEKVAAQSAHALSELTDGIHLHTISCPDEAAYLRVCAELKARGFLVE